MLVRHCKTRTVYFSALTAEWEELNARLNPTLHTRARYETGSNTHGVENVLFQHFAPNLAL